MRDRLVSSPAASAPAPAKGRSGAADSGADLFARLEERVIQLVERHRETQKTLRELEERLQESQSRAARLELELAERDALRDQLRVRLDRVIDWVRALESAAAAAAEDADSPDAEEPPGEGPEPGERELAGAGGC